MGVNFRAEGGYGFPLDLRELISSNNKDLQKVIWGRLNQEQRDYYGDVEELFSDGGYDEESIEEAFPEIRFIYTDNPYEDPRWKSKNSSWSPSILAVVKRTYRMADEQSSSRILPVEGFKLNWEEFESLDLLSRFSDPEHRQPEWRIVFTIS